MAAAVVQTLLLAPFLNSSPAAAAAAVQTLALVWTLTSIVIAWPAFTLSAPLGSPWTTPIASLSPVRRLLCHTFLLWKSFTILAPAGNSRTTLVASPSPLGNPLDHIFLQHGKKKLSPLLHHQESLGPHLFPLLSGSSWPTPSS
eukprot:scaffold27492_cov16-Tisochrysis_lutea.AAC.2